MIFIKNLNQAQINKPLCLTIGNFDGIHLGHQKILKQVKNTANENNLQSGVLSFEPHPYFFFKKEKLTNFRIFNLSQKINLIKEQKIDYLIILQFNNNFAQITAEDFIKKILIDKLNLKKLIVGYDFAFGKNRLGNFHTLVKAAQENNFSVNKIDQLTIDNKICSSSLIREYIMQGDFLNCSKFLGQNFYITSAVISGQKIARQIGFPTINLLPKKGLIKPKYGVYKTTTYIPKLDKKFPSITNFGIKPTINNQKKELYETHILNFNGDLYNQKIKIEFHDFLREEKKFANIDQLKTQIENDIKLAFNHENKLVF